LAWVGEQTLGVVSPVVAHRLSSIDHSALEPGHVTGAFAEEVDCNIDAAGLERGYEPVRTLLEPPTAVSNHPINVVESHRIVAPAFKIGRPPIRDRVVGRKTRHSRKVRPYQDPSCPFGVLLEPEMGPVGDEPPLCPRSGEAG
jgi:hypothetical protein